MSAPPNSARILRGLKAFQRDTVEHVFRRLYCDDPPARRFLIADEVGLGKTLVARGLIARAVEHLWTRIEHINIVYICSNAEIAEQNIKRLRITDQNYAFSARPTLLPFYTQDLKRNRLNFISFTPGTAFNLKAGGGVQWERVLLYWLLNDAWNISQAPGSIEVLRERAGWEGFANRVQQSGTYDRSLTEPFLRWIRQRLDLRDQFLELCNKAAERGYLNTVENRTRRQLIGALRIQLAQSCFTGLNPTLIVLDEFQRFKDVLQPPPTDEEEEDDNNNLAAQFFAYAQTHPDARVLLLSATPYKMYTLSHESENHYQDFLQTLGFLQNGPIEDIKLLVEQYRQALLQLGGIGSIAQAEAAKTALQNRLHQLMVRTERLAATADRNGMLKPVRAHIGALTDGDIEAYIALHQVAQIIQHHDPIEYWKSSPYLLNFMGKDEYKLKQRIIETLNDPTRRAELVRVFSGPGNMLLNWQDVASYRALDPANARLRSLIDDVVANDAWQLLWIPPALPYYSHPKDSHSPYAQPTLQRFTKRLIFSSWQVVPKVVAGLLSYAVEQRIVEQAGVSIQNTPEVRPRRGKLLRIAPSEKGNPGSMSLLVLLYPCLTLAIECDPLTVARKHYEQTGGRRPSLDSVRTHFERKIGELLDQALPPDIGYGSEDEQWYWVAPLLLDRRFYQQITRDWFSAPNLAAIWASAGLEEDSEQEVSEHWVAHVRRARETFEGRFRPHGRRPADLARVLAEMAMAGPGVVALRALWRVMDTPQRQVSSDAKIKQLNVRYHASWVAWSFRALFNQPDVTDMLRAHNRQDPYWRRVLTYCVEGNLQATLDEYVHVLRESLGLLEQEPDAITYAIGEEIYGALNLHVASVGVDEVKVGTAQQISDPTRHFMRNHFAVRFSDAKTEDKIDENQRARSSKIRQSFNSPFWPFVLVTTSIGQEGLDFHTYCHAVVHWNLPSNPVDLEQREGRVHRYKGHAVRKNVAQQYGVAAVATHHRATRIERDPWDAMFTAGTGDPTRPAEARDLVPFWICVGKSHIERHVPALPLSRDYERLLELSHALTLYRMVFGQARQEDLIAHLLAKLPPDDIKAVINTLCIRLEPPPTQE